MTLYDELVARGLIAQVTDEAEINVFEEDRTRQVGQSSHHGTHHIEPDGGAVQHQALVHAQAVERA